MVFFLQKNRCLLVKANKTRKTQGDGAFYACFIKRNNEVRGICLLV